MYLSNIPHQSIKLMKSDAFWKKAAWVGGGMILFQLFYFFYLYIPELKERWNDLKPLVKYGALLVLLLTSCIVAYQFYLSKKPVLKRYSIIAFRLMLSLYLLQWIFVILYWFINPPLTLTQLGSLFSGYGLKRDYVSYSDISPSMKLAVMASEDQLFPDHDGFDIKAIKRALKYNQRQRKKTKGASTISQQVAKNLFLWQRRNFIRKGLEVYFTFMIETFWNKKVILSRYLNSVEMGPGIFGVEAAAKSYFNKSAKELSRNESAMIAACLPNPKKYTIKPMSSYVRARYDDILVQMNNIEPDEDVQELIK